MAQLQESTADCFGEMTQLFEVPDRCALRAVNATDAAVDRRGNWSQYNLAPVEGYLLVKM